MNILYISYDGILEPLGQSQVLSYLEKLSLKNKIYLLSFEKKRDLNNLTLYNTILKRIKKSNICWYKLKYHKYPLFFSTLYDFFIGFLFCTKITYTRKISLIHARSYVPALLATIIKIIFKTKFIFDMRGFWIDERVDSGIWKKNSFLFKFSKKIESLILLKSDHIVSLTEKSKKILERLYNTKNFFLPISVIPTCVDISKFYSKKNYNKNFTLGYIGTTQNWYNFDLVLKCFKQYLSIDQKSNLLILNKNEHQYILNRLKFFNISKKKIILKSINHSSISKFINKMSVGIFFIKPTFAKKASCPTRFGEFLSCGVPVITGSGIGDLDKIVESKNVGVILKKFNKYQISKSFKKIVDNKKTFTKNCRYVAENLFSLTSGVKKYNQIYKKLNKI